MNTFQNAAVRPLAQKPIFGTPISGAAGSLRHGLIFASLCNEGGGTRVENLIDRVAGTLPSAARFVSEGLDVNPAGTGVSFALPMPGLIDLAKGAFSVAALVRPSSGFTTAGSGGIAARNDGNTVGAGWQCPVSSNGAGLTIERSTTDFDALTNAVLVAGRLTWVAVTYLGDLVAANVRIYYNGVSQPLTTTANGTGTQGSDAANPFILGGINFTHLGIGTGKFSGTVLAAYVWRRALLASEVLRLQSDPFPFFDRTSLLLRSGVASGAATGGFPALFFDL